MTEHDPREQHIARVMEAWLPGRLVDAPTVSVSDVKVVTDAGFSAETIFLKAHRVSGDSNADEELVLRRQLRGHDLLHDAELRFQADVMEALHRQGGLPVATPDLVGLEEDESLLGTPFLVMERLPGRIVAQQPNYNKTGWLHDLPLSDRRRVWSNGIEAMAAVNRLDWRDGFDVMSRGKEPGLAGYVEWISDWARWAVADREFPLIEAAVTFLHTNMPEDPPIDVLWGDPIPANILYDREGEVAGLIDWEMAALGPGEIDLAWWMLFDDLFSSGMNVPRMEGLPSREETISIYERALGRQVSDLPYYEAISWLRMTLVSLRAVDRQVALGHFRAANNAWSNNPSSAGLAERVGAPDVEVGPDFFEFVTKLMGGH